MIQGVPYNEYMRNYMANKRRRVDAVLIIPPVNPMIQPVNALIIQKKPIVKHFTVMIRQDHYYFMKHHKTFQKVLKSLIWRVNWRNWVKKFDVVIEQFNDLKNAYIAYHNLDCDCDVLIVCYLL